MVVLDGVDLDSLDYIVKVPFNGSGPTGGDPLTEDLNIWYEVGWARLLIPPSYHTVPYANDVTARLAI